MKKILFTENQVRQLMDSIVTDIISEQEDVDDLPLDDEDDIEGEEDGEDETDIQPVVPKKPKKISPIDKLKAKWKEENPVLDDDVMDQTINFFNRHKNGLRPYKDPQTTTNYVNLPEITAMVVAFPDMKSILTDPVRIRDIQNYSWEQINYYVDRVSNEISTSDVDVEIKGDTIDDRIQNAYKKWEEAPNKVVNEENFIAIRVESQNQSIALSRLQHLLVERDRIGMKFCIGYMQNESTNFYFNYRNYSSYYFVMDKTKPKTDNYYISVIQAVDPNSQQIIRGPYFITPIQNGTHENQKWDDIVQHYPILSGKQDLFKFFGTTQNEINDRTLSKINFDSNSNLYFGKQPVNTQKAYINSGRLINEKVAFSTLPYNKDQNLRKEYIAATTNLDYIQRFKCNDPSDPFGVLNIIQKETPSLYKYLDGFILKQTLKLPMGVAGIKIKIIGSEYTAVYKSIEGGETLFKQKRGDLYGVMNVDTIKWEKDMGYLLTSTYPLIKMSDRSQYLLQRFTNGDGDDIFYFLLNRREYLKKDSPNFGKGTYLNNDDAHKLMESGEFRKLGYGG